MENHSVLLSVVVMAHQLVVAMEIHSALRLVADLAKKTEHQMVLKKELMMELMTALVKEPMSVH